MQKANSGKHSEVSEYNYVLHNSQIFHNLDHWIISADKYGIGHPIDLLFTWPSLLICLLTSYTRYFCILLLIINVSSLFSESLLSGYWIFIYMYDVSMMNWIFVWMYNTGKSKSYINFFFFFVTEKKKKNCERN